MPPHSWTIGSDASCDLIVNSSTVSGQHCRLTDDGGALTLSDLDSTNGTFVNGQRLRGSRTVSATDRITLGQTQTMPWPESLRPAGSPPRAVESSPQKTTQRTITLGRGSDNAVVLGETNVSTHHARLIIDADQIVLEDLGSTNGTSVGNVENKVTRSVVREGDTVFLGSTAYQVSDLIQRSKPILAKKSESPRHRERSVHLPIRNPIAWAAFGLGTLLVVPAGWFVMSLPDTEKQERASETSLADKAPAMVATADRRRESPAKQVAEEVPVERIETVLSPKEALAKALFVIVCADAQRKTPFRVGTGFAIDEQRVATSAAVIQAIEELERNGFPEVFLFSPATGEEIGIVSMTVHPRFAAANAVALEAQQEHDGLFDELELQPPTPEAFEAVKAQLVAARSRALEAIDQKTTYDVAIVKVNRRRSHWLPRSDSDGALRPNQKLSVVGYAFDVQDPYFERHASLDPDTMPSRASQWVRSTEGSAARMVAKADPRQGEYAYLGSPVLNSEGQVVGIYSRPTPPRDGGESSATPTFDAALLRRLRECLAALN